MLKVALVGRPNVGKSSLFNLLGKQARALTGATPELTRDVQYADIAFEGHSYQFADTAGLQNEQEELPQRMTELSLRAAQNADVIAFVVDVREGLTPNDEFFARLVRKLNKPILLVANKAEKTRNPDSEFLKLGFGDPLMVSTTHNQGITEFLRTLKDYEHSEAHVEQTEDRKLRLTIIGRPNAGKSTFINALLGYDRLLTGPMAGVTRDAVETPFEFDGKNCLLIDTAGMRRKSRIDDHSIEKQSVSQGIDAISQSDVVLMILDASLGVEAQDLHLAAYAVEQKKVIIFVVNKMDAVADSKIALHEIKRRLTASFAQVKEPLIFPISALKKTGLKPVLKAAFEIFKTAQTRLTTAKLNTWLDQALGKNPPPLSRLKRPMAVKYMTQVSTFPPHFVIFVGGASKLPDSYLNYLKNSLKTHFGLEQVPIEISVKVQNNPYKDKLSV